MFGLPRRERLEDSAVAHDHNGLECEWGEGKALSGRNRLECGQ
jgi:hypothetical protein